MEMRIIRALQTWAVLAVAAARGELLTYGELCKGLGFNPAQVHAGENAGPPLEQVQNFCAETGRPRLTSIIGNAANHAPGAGFAGNLAELEQYREEAFNHAWHEDHAAFCAWLEAQAE